MSTKKSPHVVTTFATAPPVRPASTRSTASATLLSAEQSRPAACSLQSRQTRSVRPVVFMPATQRVLTDPALEQTSTAAGSVGSAGAAGSTCTAVLNAQLFTPEKPQIPTAASRGALRAAPSNSPSARTGTCIFATAPALRRAAALEPPSPSSIPSFPHPSRAFALPPASALPPPSSPPFGPPSRASFPHPSALSAGLPPASFVRPFATHRSVFEPASHASDFEAATKPKQARLAALPLRETETETEEGEVRFDTDHTDPDYIPETPSRGAAPSKSTSSRPVSGSSSGFAYRRAPSPTVKTPRSPVPVPQTGSHLQGATSADEQREAKVPVGQRRGGEVRVGGGGDEEGKRRGGESSGRAGRQKTGGQLVKFSEADSLALIDICQLVFFYFTILLLELNPCHHHNRDKSLN